MEPHQERYYAYLQDRFKINFDRYEKETAELASLTSPVIAEVVSCMIDRHRRLTEDLDRLSDFEQAMNRPKTTKKWYQFWK